MENKRQIMGKMGEKLASEYLFSKGYDIVLQNFAKQFGEIDLIVRDRDKTLVMVEVKTMNKMEGGLIPEDQLTRSKIIRLRRISVFFANKHPELIDDEAGWRIDLIAVLIHKRNPAKRTAKIRHYKSIV